MSVSRVSLAAEHARAGEVQLALAGYADACAAFRRHGNHTHAITAIRDLITFLGRNSAMTAARRCWPATVVERAASSQLRRRCRPHPRRTRRGETAGRAERLRLVVRRRPGQSDLIVSSSQPNWWKPSEPDPQRILRQPPSTRSGAVVSCTYDHSNPHSDPVPRHRHPVVTDGGLETWLLFDNGVDLPAFAAYPLVATPDGRALLTEYYAYYVDIAGERRRGRARSADVAREPGLGRHAGP